ncbi:malonate transporter subunit MadL [Zhongshania sp.]|uniref:malonate transporter subunit MadL n=1 Tax=Zhongshania sp. TaxID=1971902 RepID=UPI0035658D49
MIVYGVALLAFCTLLGGYLGDMLGIAIGVQANVGGVGIAMMFLIIMSNISSKKFHLSPMSESGIKFWSAMYIPIIVAMAAKQNMVVALSSGWMAVVAGVLAVVVGFLMVPVLSKIGNGKKPLTGDKS